jgi:chaperonin GroEL (HSP60 family)
VVDPVKLTCSALQNAVSIAAQVLTAEAAALQVKRSDYRLSKELRC